MKQSGYSLLEILLAMAILATTVVWYVNSRVHQTDDNRITKMAIDMQNILNAASAYYVDNNGWPGTVDVYEVTDGTSSLQQAGYLPAQSLVSPYGTPYHLAYFDYQPNTNLIANVYYVAALLTTAASPTSRQKQVANMIAGKFAMGSVSGPPQLVVSAGVNVPSQALYGSVAMKYGGLYHHGGCVPVPSCPIVAPGTAPLMPQIFVLPVSISGVNDQTSSNVYPISSFTAFASGAPSANPPACPNGTAAACTPLTGKAPGSGQFWRVCVQIVTQKGSVADTRSDAWGNLVTVAAYTRCQLSGEPEGTDFSIYTH